MPPTRTVAEAASKRSLPFKPPSRLSTGSATTSTGATKSKSKKHSSRKSTLSDSHATSANTTTISSDDEEDDQDETDEEGEQSYLTTKARRRSTLKSRTARPSTPRRQSTNRLLPPEENPAAILEDDPDAPAIPRNLLIRILHENFEDKNLKINKEAMSVMESYVKVFVKEAIARSRQETKAKADKAGDMTGDDWLQVEDLEKIAPQLMLDF
jgi:hypothetical protein